MSAVHLAWARVVALVCLIVSCVLPFPAGVGAGNGRVLSVCPRGCPYSSVASALQDAMPDDTVQVGPGIYLEHITMKPGVAIEGEGGNVSILTGGNAGTVVRAYGAAIDRTAVLEGMTIIAGNAMSGGGIEIRGGASPTIRGNLISANTAAADQSFGGGIFISGGQPLIAGNTFTKNYATWAGGAIAVWDESRAVIEGNLIQDNKAYQYGGGISIVRSSPTLSGNTIISNTAYYGGGVDMSDSSPEMSTNVVARNFASVHGGGVYLRSNSAPVVFANTFLTNTAYYYGGGLYMDRSSPNVNGNTFQSNVADTGGGLYVDRSSPSIARNSFMRNDASYHGGGIHVHNSSGRLDNNNINYNTAIVGGGGLGIDGHSSPRVTNNIIAANAVGVYGGAVFIDGAAPSLINNLIARNSSSSFGGGIFIENGTPLITNNSIVNNGQAGNGEGIYLSTGAIPTVTNNLITGNGYGIYSSVEYHDRTMPLVIMRNDIWNNAYGNLVNLDADNNVSADPLYVRGRDGAYYLSQVSSGQRQNSPAIDAGTASASELGLADRTTAVQDLPDRGVVDLGYHYRALYYRAYVPLIISSRP